MGQNEFQLIKDPLHLPFRSLIEEFKVTKIRTALLYKLFKDEKVAGIESFERVTIGRRATS